MKNRAIYVVGTRIVDEVSQRVTYVSNLCMRSDGAGRINGLIRIVRIILHYVMCKGAVENIS